MRPGYRTERHLLAGTGAVRTAPPYFIEAEYTAGGNLLEWAESRGGLARILLEERLELVAQTAVALSAAHSVGLLHKDIKPANLLIHQRGDGKPRIRLCDFGVGVLTERERLRAAGITAMGLSGEDDEDSSSYAGTRLYMAPELLEGRPATIGADVYSLGVLLYQVAAGDFNRALAPGWDRDIQTLRRICPALLSELGELGGS